MPETIDALGGPLAFKFSAGDRKALLLTGEEGRDVVKVEARQVHHHQKEAIVTDGAGGAAWRLPSDEGPQLSGTDLAPFPLGFFNAGLQSDLFQSIMRCSRKRAITIDDIEIDLINHYWVSGSFVKGTSTGHADAPDIEIRIQSAADNDTIAALVREAVLNSPAMSLLRQPLSNTFAIYINGRRRQVEGVRNSEVQGIRDPYQVYTRPPRPLAGASTGDDLVVKTGTKEMGPSTPAPATVSGKVIRNVPGYGKWNKARGMWEVETWLALPGTSHFQICSGDGERDDAPSGFALLAAGISFCYMTHLARFIQHMKLPIHGVRLVQLNEFEFDAMGARVLPVDTHLFLNGEAPEAVHCELLSNAARGCYLHAASAASLEPQIKLLHNGTSVAACDFQASLSGAK